MSIQRLAALNALTLMVSISVSHAGPCTAEIDRMQARIDARLGANAAAGPSARENTAATSHRQPTPGSIAAAEERLGEESARMAEAVASAMVRAREADNAGDKGTCEQALAAAQRAIGPQTPARSAPEAGSLPAPQSSYWSSRSADYLRQFRFASVQR
ncbi:MAG TPA: hypothetical protein VKP67_08500 [Xanthobacteraceae bacterium]|nr:hypothetical protein [Xanthobacteraceae bacterium]